MTKGTAAVSGWLSKAMSEGLNYENDVLTVQKDSDKDRDLIAIKKDGDYAVKSEIVQSDSKTAVIKIS